MGLLDPSTSDGRVIFFLPWQKLTIAGTTDCPCPVTYTPSPSEKDIQFILGEVKNYLNPDLEGRKSNQQLKIWIRFKNVSQFLQFEEATSFQPGLEFALLCLIRINLTHSPWPEIISSM